MGWITIDALGDECLEANTRGRGKMADAFVSTAKIQDAAVTIDKVDSTLLKYLLSVARVDYGHVGYCKVG